MWALTEAEIDVRERARAVARDIQPDVLALRDGDPYPAAIHAALVDAGLLGLPFPASLGGAEAGLLATCVAIEEIARVSLTASMIVGAASLSGLPILLAGSAEQQERWLPGIVEGRLRGAFCLSEPHAGSDVASLQTRARRSGDGWVIDGIKRFIGNAGSADVYVVYARTGGPGPHGISAFLVPTDTPGVSSEPLEAMGLPGWDLGAPRFEEAEVPADCLLGAEGEGFRVAMATLERSRPTVGAQSVGLAQGAIDLALEYALRREAFGRPLLDHQAIAFALAGLEAEAAAARVLTYQAAALAQDGGAPRTEVAAMSKLVSSNVAMRAATEAVQVLGGNGYLRSFPAERIMRDAKVLQIFEGASEIQKLVISRQMRRRATQEPPVWPTVVPPAPDGSIPVA